MSEPRTEAGRRLLDFIAGARFVTNPEHDECHLAALGMVAGIPGILTIEAEAATPEPLTAPPDDGHEHSHNWFETRGHPPTDERGRELAPGALLGYWCACGAMALATPDPRVERLEAALDEAIGIIETADNRAMAADGPVGRTADEMSDNEWRRMYLALKRARALLRSPQERSGE